MRVTLHPDRCALLADDSLGVLRIRPLVVLEHAKFPLKLGNLLLNGLPFCILCFVGLEEASCIPCRMIARANIAFVELESQPVTLNGPFTLGTELYAA